MIVSRHYENGAAEIKRALIPS